MNSYTPQSSFIGTTRYVSDKKVLTESYGFDGDVAYVIGKTGEKFTIKESYAKYNHEWTKIEGSSSDSDSTSGKEITKVSELENDSNYQTDADVKSALTDYAKTSEVDEQVTKKIADVVAGAPEAFDTLKELADWIENHQTDATAMNSAINKNSSDIANVQSSVSDHTNNSDIHVTKAEKEKWDSKSDFSGSYNDLTDTPVIPDVKEWALADNKPVYTATEVGALAADTAIPSKVSELENDSNYQDETSVDNKISTSLESYAKTADVTTAIETAVEPYAKSEDVESKIAETKTSLTESINTVADKMVLPAPYVENDKILYCNGYGVIIEKVDDNTNKAIYYQLESKKEIQFPANISVVAGAKNKNCDNTCVIMNSGNILQVYGGSAGKGNVGNATIIINGGSISDAITGGGMIFGLGNVDGNQKFTNHVGVTNIVINNTDNNVSLVYGGAYSHGTVGKANVVLNNGSAQYVTAAGSNGYTADASLTINNGKYHVVQGVNRGDTSDVHIVVNGGTIDNLYAGSESDKSCTANFIHSDVVLNGGKVTKLAAGYNGGADYNPVGYVTGSYKSGILTDESNATSMNFVKNDDVLKKTDDTVILDGKKITFAEDGTVHWENV
jgi:hypothetical protein